MEGMSAKRKSEGQCKIYVQLHTQKEVLERGLLTAIVFVTPRADQFSLIQK